MGVVVVEAAPERVILEAPLEPNVNHRLTAFGGSVAAVAMLAGWTLTELGLRGEGRSARTVIRSSSVTYDAPIHGTFRAECGPPEPARWSRLVRALERRGKGRIRIPVQVTAGPVAVATFEGVYVALASAHEERG
jgi:thioesterase domain-containing protein